MTKDATLFPDSELFAATNNAKSELPPRANIGRFWWGMPDIDLTTESREAEDNDEF